MIVLPVSSQITYTINNKEYICYTKDENRKLAIAIYNSSNDRKLISNYYNQINNYKLLINTYKTDSTVYVNKLNYQYEAYDKLNNNLSNAIDINKTYALKIKRKNKWITGLSIGCTIVTGSLIYILTK